MTNCAFCSNDAVIKVTMTVALVDGRVVGIEETYLCESCVHQAQRIGHMFQASQTTQELKS